MHVMTDFMEEDTDRPPVAQDMPTTSLGHTSGNRRTLRCVGMLPVPEIVVKAWRATTRTAQNRNREPRFKKHLVYTC